MLKTAKQTDHQKIQDRVFAAMETGNHAQARTILTEYREVDLAAAEDIRAEVIAGYGIAI